MTIAVTIIVARVIRRLRSARLKFTMNRGITRLHRGMTAATRLRRILNRAAAAVVAAHRRMAAARHMEAVATATQDRPRIPSTASVLAPSLRI